ncbi:alpha/beta hydrolase [Rhodopirellula sp. MGV]|uniref:alpha/beta hydrolase n=1 Tax=Rhodopirellula sp. MGV TaxID=2023130 RepID=UPI000B97343F|nr:alpha/beta hydrolase [Rhodopirellula sp. MGV]OYP34899.1 lipase [Rhodopirellula sp. MGV]PNY38204.1 alpha/beta hydrolase [Rhodopirellula baltica]
MTTLRTLLLAVLPWIVLPAVTCPSAFGQSDDSGIDYKTHSDLPYRTEDGSLSDYARERCRLDVYAPANRPGFSTVVWFHGGGLTGGQKSIPKALQEQGIAVVGVNYRLSPKVKSPAYVQDAAAAVAWVFHNIERFGGDPKRIYVSGHSAGGYLTSMIGLDKSYLAEHGVDADDIAGLIPYSGHTITHFTVRAERGIDGKQPIVDSMAPLFHVRKDCPPLLLITGDRELEMLGRYEETAYLWRMMQVVEHPETKLVELKGYDHGQMAEPAHPLLLKFIKEHEAGD